MMTKPLHNVKSRSSLTEKAAGRKLIQSVDRALAILEEIASSDGPVGLKELSARLCLNPTTTFHLLGTLVARDFVVQDPYTKKYKLGLKMLKFTGPILDGLEFRSEARPFLVSLMEQTEETVNLVVFDKGEAIYVDQVQSKRASMFRAFTRIGTRVPLHCTGVGKIYLAHLSEEEVKAIVKEKGLPQFTSNTIATLDRLLEELKRVRELGYALDDEEREEGVRCIAAPLTWGDGRVTAAISVSGPASRLTREKISFIVPIVLEAARAASERLGLIMGFEGDWRGDHAGSRGRSQDSGE